MVEFISHLYQYFGRNLRQDTMDMFVVVMTTVEIMEIMENGFWAFFFTPLLLSMLENYRIKCIYLIR